MKKAAPDVHVQGLLFFVWWFVKRESSRFIWLLQTAEASANP